MPQIIANVNSWINMGEIGINPKQHFGRSVKPRISWEGGIVPSEINPDKKIIGEPIEIRIFVVPIMNTNFDEKKTNYADSGIRQIHQNNYGSRKVTVSLIFRQKFFLRNDVYDNLDQWYLIVGKRFNDSQVEWMYTNKFQITEKKQETEAETEEDKNSQKAIPKFFEKIEEVKESIATITQIWTRSVKERAASSVTNNNNQNHIPVYDDDIPIDPNQSMDINHFPDYNHFAIGSEIDPSNFYHQGYDQNTQDVFGNINNNNNKASRPSSPDVFTDYTTTHQPDYHMDLEVCNNNNNYPQENFGPKPQPNFFGPSNSTGYIPPSLPVVSSDENFHHHRPKPQSVTSSSSSSMPMMINERWMQMLARHTHALNNNTASLNIFHNSLINNNRMNNIAQTRCSCMNHCHTRHDEDDMEIEQRLDDMNNRVVNLLSFMKNKNA